MHLLELSGHFLLSVRQPIVLGPTWVPPWLVPFQTFACKLLFQYAARVNGPLLR